MSSANGLNKFECPVHQNWHRIDTAINRSEARKDMLDNVAVKISQLDSLPAIAAEVKALNRNNSILLIILGLLLIINAVADAGINFKGSALGASTEITQKEK